MMATILERIMDRIGGDYRQLKVRRAVIGTGYIMVEVDECRVGLSANISHSRNEDCAVWERAGAIAGSCVGVILAKGKGMHHIGRAVDIATFNAVSDLPGDYSGRYSGLPCPP
jgi:uncharacterized protein (DUF4213/DUF364 family)